jgi:Na+-driven multidrug efflux pump
VITSDPKVAMEATTYIQWRLLGFAPALVMMVGIGACRGLRDMNTPLLGSLAYLISLTILDAVLVPGLGFAVRGAGAAAALAQVVGATVIAGRLWARGAFFPRDLLQVPDLVKATAPFVDMATSISIANIAGLGPFLVATNLASGLGPVSLAAHSLLRQLSMLWVQIFMAFGASAHSLVAAFLGAGRVPKAAAALGRIVHLAAASSIPLALTMYFARGSLPMLLAGDASVAAQVAGVLPYLLILMVGIC